MTQEIQEFYQNVYNIKEQLKLYRSSKFRILYVEAANLAEAKKQLAIIVGQIDARLKSLSSNPSQQEKDEVKDIRIFLEQLEETMKNPDEIKKINCMREAKKAIGTYGWGQVVLNALLILSGLIGNVASLVASLFGVSLVKNNKQSESTEKLMGLLSKKNKIRPVKVDRPLSVDPAYQDSKDDRAQLKITKDPLIEKRETLEVNPDVPVEQASLRITFTYIDKTKENGVSEATITLPKGVTSIDSSIFKDYKSTLTSVVIPEGVTGIYKKTFYNCTSLTSVVIPDSVTSMEGGFIKCSSLTSVVIPASVTHIDDFAFCDCSSLISVVIPASVTSIGRCAFYGCISLTSVVIPASMTFIGNEAFCGCKALTSLIIPANVTYVGEHAFSACTSLTSVVISEGVRSISAEAFVGCDSLTSVVIPASATSIRWGVFWDCRALTSVEISDSVTFIDPDAFLSCYNLTSFTINSKTPKEFQRVLNMLPPELRNLARMTEAKKALPIVQAAAHNQGFFSKNGSLPIEITSKIASSVVAATYGKKLSKEEATQGLTEEAEQGLTNGIHALLSRSK